MPPQTFTHFVPDEQPAHFVADDAAPSSYDPSQHSIPQNFQKAFDELTETPTFDRTKGMGYNLSVPLQNLGVGALKMMTPIFHPIDTAKAFTGPHGGGLADTVLSNIKPLAKEFSSHPVESLWQAIPAFADPEGAESTVRGMGEATERGGLNLGNAALGARGPKLFKFGANPARGAFEEGVLPAMSKHSAAMKLESALPEAGQRVAAKVATGADVPSSRIAQSIEGPISKAGEVMSGFGGGRPVDPLTNLWASMEEKAPQASTPIYGSRAPGMVPANDLWRSIQNLDKNTRFNPDPEVEGLNEIRREMRGGLRGNLEEATPGLKPISQRYGDLKAAEEALDRTMHSGTGLQKMMKIPGFPLESGAGKALYSSGKVIQGMAPAAGFAVRSAPVAEFISSLRKKEK